MPTAPTATPQPISRLGEAAPDGVEDAAAPDPEAEAPEREAEPDCEPDCEAADVAEAPEVVEAEGATTVAVSTEVVAGTCEVSFCSILTLQPTYGYGRLAVLDLEVVGSDEVSESGLLDVAVQEHRAERGVGRGQVGRGLEGRGLQVDEDGVSVGARSLSRSRTGVVGAWGQ